MRFGFKRWRKQRTLTRHPIADGDWRRALAHCAPASRLSDPERLRLRELATLLLRRKKLEPVQGLELNAADRALLAAHASLPILHLGLGWYDDWQSIVIYPDLFIPQRGQMDASGVVHHARDILAGEAWLRGPVILAWRDVVSADTPPGHNVVVHEMAHALDMRNGQANGYPPLPKGMHIPAWTEAFTTAWNRLQARFEAGEPLPIDDYALENPGEFFAVASEVFFEQPELLEAELPALFRQLHRFYKGT